MAEIEQGSTMNMVSVYYWLLL
ncbi:Protein of unknown function [Leuconostoc citreum LBAE C11]|nr:Protein of unknown function [Leuconostoc citreum LBAE C11]